MTVCLQQLLPDAQLHSQPFAHLTSARALPGPALEELAALFDQELPWVRHYKSFYKAWMVDVDERVDPALLVGLRGRMSELTGLPLDAHVGVTLQRMESGQHALAHTDRPLCGYEALRLIVQLNPDWRPEHGGELLLHSDVEGAEEAVRRPPVWNSAFGFVMRPDSVHSVRPSARTRRTVVFHFWHLGNRRAVRPWVEQQLQELSFGALPSALDPIIEQAERSQGEEQTLRAGTVACLLQRWGCDEALLREGYLEGLSPLSQPKGAAEVLLARWVQRLAYQDFDLPLWRALAPRFASPQVRENPCLREGVALLFSLDALGAPRGR